MSALNRRIPDAPLSAVRLSAHYSTSLNVKSSSSRQSRASPAEPLWGLGSAGTQRPPRECPRSGPAVGASRSSTTRWGPCAGGICLAPAWAPPSREP